MTHAQTLPAQDQAEPTKQDPAKTAEEQANKNGTKALAATVEMQNNIAALQHQTAKEKGDGVEPTPTKPKTPEKTDAPAANTNEAAPAAPAANANEPATATAAAPAAPTAPASPAAKLAKIIVDRAAGGRIRSGEFDKVEGFMTKVVEDLFAKSDVKLQQNFQNFLNDKDKRTVDEYLPNVLNLSTQFLKDSGAINSKTNLFNQYVYYPALYVVTYLIDAFRVLIGRDSYKKGDSILNGSFKDGWVANADLKALTDYAAIVLTNKDDKEVKKTTTQETFVEKLLAEKAAKEITGFEAAPAR